METSQIKCNNTPPTTNLKCIVFTFLIVGIYLLPKNKWILLLLLYFPYLWMSWYDEIYSCERNFGPTYLRLFYEMWKPYDSPQRIAYRNWCPVHANKVFIIDMIILVVFLIFFYYVFLPWNF